MYHGCLTCYDGATKSPSSGASMKLLNEKTAETLSKLKSLGFTVIEIWEHNFRQLKKADVNLINFLKTHDVQDRLNPRDAFHEGSNKCHQTIL